MIVDDGSTDSTRNIRRASQADLPSESGTGHALKRARGEFVAFIDADDWIERETYATMYEAAVANLRIYAGITKSYRAKANMPLDRDAIKAEILTDFLYNGSYGGVWKVIRKSLIDTYGSRRGLAVQYGRVIDKPLYHYRQINDESLIRKYNPQL